MRRHTIAILATTSTLVILVTSALGQRRDRAALRSLATTLVACDTLPAPGGQAAPAVLPASVTHAAPSASAARAAHAADERFIHSKRCALCHDQSERATAMRDEKKRGIAPYDLWQGTMMANSTRDPFWRAAVRAELVTSPKDKHAEIESTCMRCHAPMASASKDDREIRLDRLDPAHPRSELANDGVSCTVCHQITDKNLGDEKSFSGHFEINEEDRIYGPHEDPFFGPMLRFTGKRPTKADHILDSGHCATCHTLVHGEHAEQAPFLEWRNSEFSGKKSCQDCHVPTTSVDGFPLGTRIAHNPGGRDFGTNERLPYGRHVFVGGNTLIPAILRDNARELGVTAPRSAFDATIEAARRQLATKTARLTIGMVGRQGERLRIPLRVDNDCGHKFPTGYPSRRAWIHLRVLDAKDRVVFASGAWDREGRIVDRKGKPLAFEQRGGPISTHKQRITRSEQVQIYQVVQGDAERKVVWRLLAAKGWVKDNRLLPRGWKVTHKDAERTRPIGIGEDLDFVGGSDELVYEVNAAQSDGPYRIEAEIVYQTLAPRWAAELFAIEGPEIERFERMWKLADRRPVVVSRARKVEAR